MGKPVLGAQLYTVRAFTQTLPDIKTTLKKVADIGYKAVQISAIGPVDPGEVARVMEDNGLVVAATHMSWDSFLNDLDGVIETHKIWKCRHPAIGGLPKEYYSLEGLRRFKEELIPIAESLAKEGMDFSYHNHSHELVRYGKKTWLELLYEEIGPWHLKAELDVYWLQHGGADPAFWVRRLGGRQPLLHLKDMRITPEREQRFAEIGEGNLNWPAILDAAKKNKVEWYLVEQDEGYDIDPFESLAISYRNLKAMGLS